MGQVVVWMIAAGCLLGIVWRTEAQVPAPNRAGVAMGHLHFTVHDVDAHRRFWLALGAAPAKGWGRAAVLRLPGLLIVLDGGDSLGPMEGSVVNHLALRVKAFAGIEAAGVQVRRRSIAGRQSATVETPSGDQVELFEEHAEQTRFVLAPGWVDAVANRHNEPLPAPVVPHHLHLNVPEGADGVAQAWYVGTFGAVPGSRLRYRAADLPGMNLNFSGVTTQTLPTSGRTLDHVGLEVRSLRAFCQKLDTSSVRLDGPCARDADGVSTARLVDPWGTSIELTEGLDGWK